MKYREQTGRAGNMETEKNKSNLTISNFVNHFNKLIWNEQLRKKWTEINEITFFIQIFYKIKIIQSFE